MPIMSAYRDAGREPMRWVDSEVNPLLADALAKRFADSCGIVDDVRDSSE